MLINAIYSFIKIVSDFINEYFFNHLNTSMDEAKKEESNVELEEGQIISVEEEMKGNESVKSTPVKNINQKQDVVEEKAKSISIKEELTNEDMVILNKEEVCEVLIKEEKKEDEIDKNNNIINEDIKEDNKMKIDKDNNELLLNKEQKEEDNNIDEVKKEEDILLENKEKQMESDNNFLDNNKETNPNNINNDEEEVKGKESENNNAIEQFDKEQPMEIDGNKQNEENKPIEENTQIKEEDKPKEEVKPKPEIKYQSHLSIDDFSEETRAFIGDYICTLCKGIYFNPVLTSCSHTFCKDCFDTFTSYQTSEESNEGKYKCPLCGSIISSYPFPVEIISVLLNKQHIRCKNRNFGCSWEGILSQLMDHLDNICPKQTIQCTLQGCTEKLFREDLVNHLTVCKYRIVQCEFCLLNLPYIELQGHLDEICPKIKIECPQKCGQFIEREKLEEHLKNECGNTIITCPFGYFKCNTVLLQKDLQKHLSDEVHNHLKLCMEKMQQIDNQVHQMDGHIEQIDTQLNVKIEDVKNDNENIKKQIAIIPPPVIQKEYLVISKNNDDDISFIGQKRKDPQEDFIVEQNKDSLLSICPIEKKKTNDNLSISNNINGLTILNKPNQGINNIKRNEVFDTKFISPFIELSNNRAKLHERAKYQYSYLFSNYNINCINNYESSYFIKWSVTLLSETKWIGCGLCSKNEVINNNYSFQPAVKPDGIKGVFIISSNGYGFNCNKNDSQVIINHSLTNIGDVMEFYYYPKKKELIVHFKCIDNRVFTGKMNEVYPREGFFLTPCIVFIHSGNEIELSKFSYI